jgi:predicted Ser/Thr protein kinase
MKTTNDQWDLRVSACFREVATCVDRYEDGIRAGLPAFSDLRPLFSELLQGVSAVYRSEALAELVQVDMEHRRQQGEEASLAAYQRAFPELRDNERVATSNALRATVTLSTGDTDKLRMTPIAYHATEVSLPPTPALQWIGRYEIKSELGRGTFGIVYHGRDPQMQRDVAIKIAYGSTTGGLASDQAFLHEAQTAAALRHANLVAVLDFGESEDERPYIVYEYVAGRTLGQYIVQGNYTVPQAVEWVAAVADGLHEVHKRHIVHRDIKPANILIDEQQSPRLTDFGLARRNDQFFVDDRKLLGTAQYMSPEQADKRADWASPAADIYSLGAVLYELLCNRPPFRADSLDQLLEQVKHRQPDAPRTTNDAIPHAVEDICLKALSKNPADRFRTAKDLSQALRRTQRPRRHWLPWAGVAALVASLAVLLVVPSGRREAIPSPLPEPLAVRYLRADVRQQNKVGDYPVPQTLPRTGDEIQLTAHLSRTAYLYLFIFDSTGKPTLCWPPDLDQPTPRLDVSTSLLAPNGKGMMLVLCGATEKPLDRTRVQELLMLAGLPEPLATQTKLPSFAHPLPPTMKNADDFRGGRPSDAPADSFPIPQQFKDAAGRTFDAYYGIMFSHFDR